MDTTDNYLRAYRKRTYITQFDISFLLGLDENSLLSRWESGTRPLTLEPVIVYSLLFNVSPTEFLNKQREVIKQKLLVSIPQLLSMLKSQDKTANVQARINHLEETLTRLTHEIHE